MRWSGSDASRLGRPLASGAACLGMALASAQRVWAMDPGLAAAREAGSLVLATGLLATLVVLRLRAPRHAHLLGRLHREGCTGKSLRRRLQAGALWTGLSGGLFGSLLVVLCTGSPPSALPVGLGAMVAPGLALLGEGDLAGACLEGLRAAAGPPRGTPPGPSPAARGTPTRPRTAPAGRRPGAAP